MKAYIGFDPREQDAFDVCVASLKKHASIPVEVVPLRDWELRRQGVYWRAYYVEPNGQTVDGRDGRPFSTQFSFSRFAVPIIENYADEWVLYQDCDMLWRADIAELSGLIDYTKSVMCVRHSQTVTDGVKMDGRIQSKNEHGRKNWSSLMLMNPAACKGLTKYVLNNSTGAFLHSMLWAKDDEIGFLPKEWNHLVGYDEPTDNARVVHFTNGTPDMEGWGDQPFSEEWRTYLQARAA